MRSEYDVLDDGALEDAVENGVVYETIAQDGLCRYCFAADIH